MRSAFRLAVLAAATGAFVFAQTPSENGTISGRVVDQLTRRSVAGAAVDLYTTTDGARLAKSVRKAVTDAFGLFTFAEVEPGAYRLDATNEDGIGRYGAKAARGHGRSLHVTAGGRVDNVIVPLWRLGTIVGRVTDQEGAPLTDIDVHIEPTDESGSPKRVKTDAAGQYRAVRVAPATYLVLVDSWLLNLPLDGSAPRSALGTFRGSPFLIDGDRRTVMLAAFPFVAPKGDRPRMFVTSVHSRGRSRTAAPIRIAPGEVQRGIDIVLRASTGVRVAGRLVTPSGPVSGGVVTLRAVHLPPSYGIDPITAAARPDGTFAFLAVPAGHYVLTAQRRIPSFTPARLDLFDRPATAMDDFEGTDEEDYFLRTELDVATTDVPDLALVMEPGTIVSGTLTVDGHAPLSGKMACVYLSPLENRRIAKVGCGGADGSFVVKARPGTYIVTAGPRSRDWAFDGMSVGGREMGDGPILVGRQPITNLGVRLTPQRRGVAGTIRTSDGGRPETAGVIVFPRERKWWANLETHPDRRNRAISRDGRFEFLGLLPGEYFVAAVDEDLLAGGVVPATLKRVVRFATRVRITDSGVTNIRLALR